MCYVFIYDRCIWLLFNKNYELDPAELMEEDSTQIETLLDNVGMPPLINQSPSQYLTLIESPDSPDSPPPGVHKEVSVAACLASVVDLPSKSLTDADAKILGVYQDWVHQNPGMHMDGGIEDDSKLQERSKNWLLCPLNALTYRLVRLEIDLLELLM